MATGHQHSQSLSSRPQIMNAPLILSNNPDLSSTKNNFGPSNKMSSQPQMAPIQNHIGVPALQMPALQQYITSPKNPSNNLNMSQSIDRKQVPEDISGGKNGKDYQLIQAFQQTKWREQLAQRRKKILFFSPYLQET